jgi:hypothetical protein
MARSKQPRTENDAYYTPPALAAALVARLGLRPGARVLEPSCGGGAFVGPLLAAGAEVYALDLDQGAEGLQLLPEERRAVADFGAWSPPPTWPRFDAIVANPPYTSIDEHLAAAMRLADRVIFLLRSTWLSSGFRALDLLDLTPARMWMPTPRPSFRADGQTDSAPAIAVEWRVGEAWETRFELLPWRSARETTRSPHWASVCAAWRDQAEPGRLPSTSAQRRVRSRLRDLAERDPAASVLFRGGPCPAVSLLPWCGQLDSTDCATILAALEAP